jgi:putative hydrolase of the HAD superfamily
MKPRVAIGFDFDHTLGVDNGLERKALAKYATQLGVPVDPDSAEWKPQLDALLGRFRNGEHGVDAMMGAFAATIGVSRTDGDAWRELCYGLVDELVEPLAGAHDTLRALERLGVPVAILTNGWNPLQQKKIVRALGDAAPTHVIVSGDIAAIKPARAAFDALVGVLEQPRDHVWYVGDTPGGDVGGALAAGLRAVWFDWEGLSYPADVPPPTLRIHALGELLALVENT